MRWFHDNLVKFPFKLHIQSIYLVEMCISKIQNILPIPVAARSKAWVCGDRLLGLWVRIPPKTCMSVSCECCVLSGRGLCVGLITRPWESYRVWYVLTACNRETSAIRRPRPTTAVEPLGKIKKKMLRTAFYFSVYVSALKIKRVWIQRVITHKTF
jgi:hypothetical protein